MATDKMYDLAFEFQKTRLWKKLKPQEIFAVQLPDEQLGYCCTAGVGKDAFFIHVFVGESGYWSFRRLFSDAPSGVDQVDRDQLDTLACAYKKQSELSEETREEIKTYAKKYNKKLNGNVYPLFARLRPGKASWMLSEEEEQQICEVLSAAVALNKILDKCTKKELGFQNLEETGHGTEIPLLYSEKGNWKRGRTKLPQGEIQWFSTTVFSNDVLADSIKQKEKKGVWECELTRLKQITQNNEKEAPYFPWVFYIADKGKKEFMVPIIQFDSDMELADILTKFAERLDGWDCPEVLYAGNKRTYFFLRDFCAKAGVKLKLATGWMFLDDLIDDINVSFEKISNGIFSSGTDDDDDDDLGDIDFEFDDDDDDDDDEYDFHYADADADPELRISIEGDEEEAKSILETLELLICALNVLEDEQILRMPAELREMTCELNDAGLLPKNLSKKIHRLFPNG